MSELTPSEAATAATNKWKTVMTAEYEAGADDVEVCAALHLSRKDFDQYYSSNPEFRNTVDVGRLKSSAWWRGVGRKNITNKSFNTSIWAFTMKNREGWAEKSETTSSTQTGPQKTMDELRSEISALAPSLLKKLQLTKKDSELVMLELPPNDE